MRPVSADRQRNHEFAGTKNKKIFAANRFVNCRRYGPARRSGDNRRFEHSPEDESPEEKIFVPAIRLARTDSPVATVPTVDAWRFRLWRIVGADVGHSPIVAVSGDCGRVQSRRIGHFPAIVGHSRP